MTHDTFNEKQDAQEVLRRFFASGGAVRMLADIRLDDMDHLYAYATQLFEADEFKGARNLYFLLAQLDQWNSDYWLGLGLCHQRLMQHEDALFCFSRAGMIKIDDPRASFFAGISYQIVGNQSYARKALNASIKWCGQHAQYVTLRQSAEQLLACCAQEESICPSH